MAYREKVWNANVLTDLLSTYLTHGAQEREKYYQAELKKKPTFKAFGDELLKYDSAGNFVEVARRKDPTTKPLDTLYPVGEGQPVMTRQVGSQTQYINPATSKWEIMPPDVLSGYKTDVPKVDPTLPYVTWNRKKDDGTFEEVSVVKGQQPQGENWSVGQAPKDPTPAYKPGQHKTFTVGGETITGEYTGLDTDKVGEAVGFKQVATAPRFKPEAKAYKVGELKEIKVGDNIVTAVYTGLDTDKVGEAPGWKEAETAPRFKADSPAHKVGDFEVFEIGNRKVKARFTGLDTDKVGDAPGWSQVSSAPRFKEGFAVWNRINPDTGLPEEQTLKDTERPTEGKGWNLGKAGDPLSFVTWNKLNSDGTYSEKSEKRGHRPAGEGWTEGQAPSASVDLADYRTRKKEVLRMARAERDHLKDIKDEKVDMLGLRPSLPWDPDTMLPAMKYYNAVLKDPDKWMEENEGLPVYGRIEKGEDIPKFKFNTPNPAQVIE